MGGQTQVTAQSVVAPGQDPAGGHVVSQQPLGVQGQSPPDGSVRTTVPMETGGAGGNIGVGPRPGMQVMSATPNGIMCTMTPEVWQQLLIGGLLNFQQPAGQSAPPGFQFPVYQQQQQQQDPQPGPSGLQSGLMGGPLMPKGRRADSERPLTQGEWWGVHPTSRSASWAESGIIGSILTEIRADYDLSNYPYESQVTFYIYTYVEVNGIRRLLRIRTIPEQ